jgi:hypothetical protein
VGACTPCWVWDRRTGVGGGGGGGGGGGAITTICSLAVPRKVRVRGTRRESTMGKVTKQAVPVTECTNSEQHEASTAAHTKESQLARNARLE